MTKKIAILKTGTTHPKLRKIFGDFEDWFSNGIQGAHFTTFDLPNGDPTPQVMDFHGYIVTGSPAMVTEREVWSENLKPLLRAIIEEEKYLLAVCYGHQLLADALGGQAGWHPKGREIGTVSIQQTAEAEHDPLFSTLPSHFLAQVTHAQSVLSQPENAVRLAFNDYEPNHAYRIGSRAWSTQFHPEFSDDVMRGYLFETAEKLLQSNIPVKELLKQVEKTQADSRFIQRFVDLIED